MFQATSVPHASVHGFVKGHSTTSGALPHVGAKLVLAVDLRNFFGQIDYSRIARSVEAAFDSDVCHWIEGTCFVEGALPLGFRTSPALSNIAFGPTDERIAEFCGRNEVVYSRWVDDLSFSGPGVDEHFLEALQNLLGADGWSVNHSKTRYMRRSPYVLGLYVGHDVDRPRLPRWLKRRLLLETYYFARFGQDHFDRPGVFSREKLFGFIAYCKSVEPDLARELSSRIRIGSRL